jgi:hypothetical protein
MSANDENAGGDSGGTDNAAPQRLQLRRSELAILRRQADRYPIGPADRADVVDKVMSIVNTAKSFRHVIAAARTIDALDRTNLKELGVAIEAVKEQTPLALPVAQSGPTTINISIGCSFHTLVEAVEQGKVIPKEVLDALPEERLLELHRLSIRRVI